MSGLGSREMKKLPSTGSLWCDFLFVEDIIGKSDRKALEWYTNRIKRRGEDAGCMLIRFPAFVFSYSEESLKMTKYNSLCTWNTTNSPYTEVLNQLGHHTEVPVEGTMSENFHSVSHHPWLTKSLNSISQLKSSINSETKKCCFSRILIRNFSDCLVHFLGPGMKVGFQYKIRDTN